MKTAVPTSIKTDRRKKLGELVGKSHRVEHSEALSDERLIFVIF